MTTGPSKVGFGKCVFDVHDTFPQGRFCGIKNAFWEEKVEIPAGAFFQPKKMFLVKNIENVSPARFGGLIKE